MADHRRLYVPGGTYFFTLVTAHRHPWLGRPDGRAILSRAMRAVRARHPFATTAIVVLPDHLHCIWTLPPGDVDFVVRWKSVKHRCTSELRRAGFVDGAAWHRRYWQHVIRDEDDFRRHLDYVHYDPVRHGLCEVPGQWPASSFGRYVARGVYAPDWSGPAEDIESPT